MSPEATRWIVLKFGGTSVSTAKNWATIASILRSRIAEGYRPAMVHSALSGVTSALDTVAEAVRQTIDKAGPDDAVCIAGSLYVAGEARHALVGKGIAQPGI